MNEGRLLLGPAKTTLSSGGGQRPRRRHRRTGAGPFAERRPIAVAPGAGASAPDADGDGSLGVPAGVRCPAVGHEPSAGAADVLDETAAPRAVPSPTGGSVA